MINQQHYASSSLYVGDLAPDVTEATLYDLFVTIGPLASIRVCRESGTKKSLGYAYVNYQSTADAQRCLEELNYSQIKGVPCRIMWSHRDPSLRRSGAGNIFVKNLDKVIDTKALHDTFSLFGNILSCKVARDELGRSKGYGFVHYELEASAKRAIERINGILIGSKKVFVGPFKKQVDRCGSRPPIFSNIYVKHFPNEWTEEIIRNLFSQYGEVQSMVLSVDQKGRRFCLINFIDPKSAVKAIEELHGRFTNATGVEPADAALKESIQQEEAISETSEQTKPDTKITEMEEKVDDKPDTTNLPPEPTSTETNAKKVDEDVVEVTIEGDGSTVAEESSKTISIDKGQPSKTEETPPTTQTDTVKATPERLYVQRAMVRSERVAMLKEAFNSSGRETKSASVNLFVKNLDPQVTDEILNEAFSRYGTVLSTKVMLNELGVSRGFGFVCFAFPEEATKAVTAMHLKLFRGKPLYVGLAERRQHRSLRLQQRYRGTPNSQAGIRAPPAVNNGLTAPPQPALHSSMVLLGQQPPLGGYAPTGAPMMYSPNASGTSATQSHMPSMYYPPQAAGNERSTHGISSASPQYTAHRALTWRGANQYSQTAGPSYPYTLSNDSAAVMQGSMRQPHQIPTSMNQDYRIRRPAGNAVVSGPMRSQQNFKFTSQARNRQDYMQQPPMQQNPQMPQTIPPPAMHEPLQAQILSEAHPQVQKQIIGERLFPLIHKHHPELAGKLTGMMLEMDTLELLSLLESEPLLIAKIDEAISVLRQHKPNPAIPSTQLPAESAPMPNPAAMLAQQ